MSQGVTIIAVSSTPISSFEVFKGNWLTGKWAVITTAAAERIFNTKFDIPQKILMDEKEFDIIFTKESETEG